MMRSRTAYFLLAMVFAVISSGCGGGNSSNAGGSVPPLVTPAGPGGGSPQGQGGGPTPASISSPDAPAQASSSPAASASAAPPVTLSGVGCSGTLNAAPTPDASGTGGTLNGQATVTCNQSGASCTGTVNVTGNVTGLDSDTIAGAVQGQGTLNCTQPSISCTASANISGSISGVVTGTNVAANITGSASLTCGGSPAPGGGGSPSPSPSCSSSSPTPSGSPQPMNVTMLTGYGWPDNTKPGSADISHPVLHQKAGGTGTFCDPITFATSASQDQTFPYGTIIYVPSLQRYFIREDVCTTSGPSVNGGNKGCPGTTLSLWVGGTSSDSASSVGACENKITASNAAIIVNAADGRPVISGPIYANGTCTP